jgi:prefoldin subunit 5
MKYSEYLNELRSLTEDNSQQIKTIDTQIDMIKKQIENIDKQKEMLNKKVADLMTRKANLGGSVVGEEK